MATIKRWDTGAIIIDRPGSIRETCEAAAREGISLACADLCDADLSGADLTCAILRDAILRDANPTSAILTGANLSSAKLSGAILYGADLFRANLAGAIGIASLGSPDGWSSLVWLNADGIARVRIECLVKTIAEGREYWRGKDDRREVLAALDYAEAIAKLRGWPIAKAEGEQS